MQEAIETLFSGRTKGDLVLLFFSGHGVKDDNGKLHLATRITRNTRRIASTSLAAPGKAFKPGSYSLTPIRSAILAIFDLLCRC